MPDRGRRETPYLPGMEHCYIHVPFCARRCSYCDFAIAVRKTVPSTEFVDLLLRERDLRCRELGRDHPLATLYLGGGTPSRLAPAELSRLIRSFPLASGAEVTMEANPDDVTPAAAEVWARAGVNRVSLGVQSFHPPVLEWMHRTHSATQPAAAVAALRAAGIGDVSLDLIFGLPARLDHDFAADLSAALDLQPNHLSIYGLTVEPRTPLARWIARGSVTPGSDEHSADEFLLAHETLGASGYEHYEVSSYARPGHRARHNAAYWSGAAYVGLGPAAHGFDGAVRRWNLRDWTAWRAALRAGNDPLEGTERLSDEQLALERLYLGLRTIDGIPAPEARGPSGEGAGPAAESLEAAVGAGWVERLGSRLKPTAQGWLRLDALLPFLTTSPGGG